MKEHYSLDDFGVTLKQETLQNGLKVGFIEKPFAPIYAKILMRAGSIYDPIGKEGLAHFTEHIIVSGSKTHTKEEFSGLIESIGGDWNAGTSRDVMTVECEVALPEHMEQMNKYFTEALSNIHLTEESLESEKSIVSSEIHRRRSNLEYQASLHIAPIFANGSVWNRPNLGSIESITTFTIEDIQKFFSKHCTLENMVLVIAGGCSWDDVVNTFGSIAFLHGEMQRLPEDPEFLPLGKKITYEQDVPQTSIEILFRCPPVVTRENYLLSSALRYAHDGITSRFYKKIRNQKGLAYSVSSIDIIFDNRKYIGTHLGVATANVATAIKAVEECYRELLQEGVSQKEIDTKIQTQWFTSIRSKEQSRDWVSTFGYDLLYPEDAPLVGLFPDIYNYRKTYTSKEIHKVLKKYITLDSYYLVLIGKGVGSE